MYNLRNKFHSYSLSFLYHLLMHTYKQCHLFICHFNNIFKIKFAKIICRYRKSGVRVKSILKPDHLTTKTKVSKSLYDTLLLHPPTHTTSWLSLVSHCKCAFDLYGGWYYVSVCKVLLLHSLILLANWFMNVENQEPSTISTWNRFPFFRMSSTTS